MSDRKVDFRASTKGPVVEGKTDETILAEQKVKMDKKELKAHLVKVMERGVTMSRLDVPLPDDMYGEWVPNDKMEIYRMESMGFTIDHEYANKRALHDGGPNGPAVVGDCVFMTCPKEVREVIDEIRREQYEAANNPKRGKQREEKEYETLGESQDMPTQLKSKVDPATVDNIRTALSV